ncbi:MAG: hypothetical protein ABI379_03355, partial [Rhodanobacter sp.]
QIQRMLENDILIQHTLTEHEIQRIATYEEDREKIKLSHGYKQIIGKIGEERIDYLFPICMRYCALGIYLHEKMDTRTVKVWINQRREEVMGPRS